MPIVDHDDVAFDVEFRAPGLPRGTLERIAWQALRRHHRGSELGQQFMRHRDQSFADADDFALTNRHPDPRETWLLRRQKSDRLIVYAGELARAFDQLPMKFQVLFDTSPRAVARERPQFLRGADAHDARYRSNRYAEQRPSEFEELPPLVLARLRSPREWFLQSLRLRTPVGVLRPIGHWPKRSRMNVEPIIFLGGKSQQRLPKSTLDGTQLFATGLLFLRATLHVNDAFASTGCPLMFNCLPLAGRIVPANSA